MFPVVYLAGVKELEVNDSRGKIDSLVDAVAAMDCFLK